MKRSADRILTTHAARVRVAVAGVVRQQIAVGLDVINDGEQLSAPR